MKKIVLRLFFIAILFLSSYSFAVPAYKGLIKANQPDGREISFFIHGDEKINWRTSEDNYTLLVNEAGYLVYATIDNQGDLVPSDVVVRNISERTYMENQFLARLQKGLWFSESQKRIMLELNEAVKGTKAARAEGLTEGVRRLLVVLAEYKDVKFKSEFKSKIENMLNQINYSEDGAMGSVRDYFRASSFGKFDLICTVAGIYTLSNDRKYYGSKSSDMIREACNLAKNDIDFPQFDNDGNGEVDGVHVIYAGLGSHNSSCTECVWPHRGTLTPSLIISNVKIIDYACTSELQKENTYNNTYEFSGIGVVAHELGHVLGLWDYYDSDYARNGIAVTLGNFDIMDNGAYLNKEKTPPMHGSYSRVSLGWAHPMVIEPNTPMDITLYPVQDTNHIIRINTENPKEYFLIENKQRTGWNEYIFPECAPGGLIQHKGGLIVTHINESCRGFSERNCINCYEDTLGIKLVSADNVYNGYKSSGDNAKFSYREMANIVFPGTSNVTNFDDTSRAKSVSWSGQYTQVPLSDIKILEDGKVSFSVCGGAKLGVRTTTLAPENITRTSALLKGVVEESENGAKEIVKRGIVWDTLPYPIISKNNNIELGVGVGEFSHQISTLSQGKRYYFRAYGVNDNGTSYGTQFTFITESDDITNNKIVDSTFAFCSTGEVPTIVGSLPEGGSGDYQYLWIESEDDINYTNASTTAIMKDYTPVKSSKQMYFKRIVFSAEKSDTSASCLVKVVSPSVGGKLTVNKDSVNINEEIQLILSDEFGDITSWQRKKNNESWKNIEGSFSKDTLIESLSDKANYSYRVVVRSGSCPLSTSNIVAVNVSSVGLADIDNNVIRVDLYPNPSEGRFSLDVKYNNKINVDIVDMQGRVVFQETNIKSKVSIDANLKAGNYILLIKDGDKIIATKQLLITK